MIELMSWPMAFAFTTSVLTVCVTLLRYFGKRPDPRTEKAHSEIETIKNRMMHYEIEHKEVWSQVLNLKELYTRESHQTRESVERLEKKMEKISDLIIALIREQS